MFYAKYAPVKENKISHLKSILLQIFLFELLCINGNQNQHF